MRLFAALSVLLLAAPVMAQDGFFSGPAIEEGAFRLKYEEAQAQVEVQQRLIAELREIVKELEAKNVCVCGEGCQCDAGGTACPCGLRGKAKAEAPKKWSITMECIPNCKACDDAKQWIEPLYRSLGWPWKTIERKEPQAGARFYPRFILCNGEACRVVEVPRLNMFDAEMGRAIEELSVPYRGNWSAVHLQNK